MLMDLIKQKAKPATPVQEPIDEIMRLSGRLAELIRAGGHSRGWTQEQVKAWHDEGEQISNILPRHIVEEIFKTA